MTAVGPDRVPANDSIGVGHFSRMRVQGHGVYMAFRASDELVLQVSTACADLLGAKAPELLGRPLSVSLGGPAAARVLDYVRAHDDLSTDNPLRLRLPGHDRDVDAIVHRPQAVAEGAGTDIVVVELEPGASRPLTYPNTYHAVRQALRDLDHAGTLQELYQVGTQRVRELTGFDRVSLYRLDQLGVAEVVAEARRPRLRSMLGLHYQPDSLPGALRARAPHDTVLMTPDVGAEPVPIHSLPIAFVDLTDSVLRSLAPHHLDYLREVGVSAAMSIELIRDDRLFGFFSCHHYSGPRYLPFEVRAAAEFIGAALTARLAVQVEREHDAAIRRASRTLADLIADSHDEDSPLGVSLTRSGGLLRLLDADGAFVVAEGKFHTVGEVPDEVGLRAITAWVLSHPAEEVVSTDSLRVSSGTVSQAAPEVAGVLGAILPDQQAVIWLRKEVLRAYDWGGDSRQMGSVMGTTGPAPAARAAMGRRREVLSAHSAPWSDDHRANAASLRGNLVEVLYLRGRRDVRATESLQRSLLPAELPIVDGWSIAARYEPAGGGFVGGDWYDALVLPSGKLALVVGDVTGHGLQAAAVMGQLRTVLRASLVSQEETLPAIKALTEVAAWTMPHEIATLAVAIVDPRTGVVDHIRLGHPPLLVVEPNGAGHWLTTMPGPPLGLSFGVPQPATGKIEPGAALVMFSDGLVERRTESIKDGLARLMRVYEQGPGTDLGTVVSSVRDRDSADDATLLVAHRLR